MTKKLLYILLAFVMLVSVLVFRALQFTSKQIQVEPLADNGEVNASEVAAHLAGALTYRTISYQDSRLFNSNQFLSFHRYLERTFPKTHRTLAKEVIEKYNLLYKWEGTDEKLKPILFLAHQDVVPVELVTVNKWTKLPFLGEISDGYIWGRGALDFKEGLIGILEAVEILLESGFEPRRTIYFAFGYDEEIGGKNGASKMAALLQSRNIEFEYILDEGSAITEGVIPGPDSPIALIGICEKGYVSAEMIVKSKGGHSSMPPRHTAIGILSAAVNKLEKNQVKGEIKEPIRQMFEFVGPEMSFSKRLVLSNLWLFGGLLEHKLWSSPVTAALIHTTTAATILEAGVKENVLPTRARAVVNFRICPGESIESVLVHIHRVVDDPRVEVNRLDTVFVSDPSVISSPESPSFKILHKTIRQIFPEVIVAPWMTIAGTDSRHYAKLSRNIYRFTPMRLTPEDLSRIHGINERISVKNYQQMVRFYMQFIRNSAL